MKNWIQTYCSLSASASQALSGISRSTRRLGFHFFVVVIGGSGGLVCLLLQFKQHWKPVSLPELFLLFGKIRVEGFGCGLWVIGSFAPFSLTSLVGLANFFIDLGSGSLSRAGRAAPWFSELTGGSQGNVHEAHSQVPTSRKHLLGSSSILKCRGPP